MGPWRSASCRRRCRRRVRSMTARPWTKSAQIWARSSSCGTRLQQQGEKRSSYYELACVSARALRSDVIWFRQKRDVAAFEFLMLHTDIFTLPLRAQAQLLTGQGRLESWYDQ